MLPVLEVWQKCFGVQVVSIPLPYRFYEADSIRSFAEVLGSFVRELEALGGQEIAPRLQAAVKLYSQIREQQRKLYALLQEDMPKIGWRQVLEVVQAGFVLDPEEYLELLGGVLAQSTRLGRSGRGNKPLRLLFAGGVLPPGDNKIIDTLCELGIEPVMDDFCSGSRNSLIKVASSRLEDIAAGYLRNVPCGAFPYPSPSQDPRLKHIRRLVEEYNIHGVVYYALRFCDAYSFKIGHLRKLLQQLGVPFLPIGTDYSMADAAQIRARLERFIEELEKVLLARLDSQGRW